MAEFREVLRDGSVGRILTLLAVNSSDGTFQVAVVGKQPGWMFKFDKVRSPILKRLKTIGGVEFWSFTGLVAGDKLTLHDPSTKTDKSYWLSITTVTADRHESQRANGTLPRSKIFNSVLLDAFGAEQRQPSIKESEWLSATETALRLLSVNAAGKVLTQSLFFAPNSEEITICADPMNWTSSKIDAGRQTRGKTLVITPQNFTGRFPGEYPDAVLFHELCHVLEYGYDGYAASANSKTNEHNLNFGTGDFFSITASNIYLSIAHRKLRADWSTEREMPLTYSNKNTGAANFARDFSSHFDSFARRQPHMRIAFAGIHAPWNPFRI
jgi:hypothetical protein